MNSWMNWSDSESLTNRMDAACIALMRAADYLYVTYPMDGGSDCKAVDLLDDARYALRNDWAASRR